jgi:predicted amino acid dehydrogenase
MSSPGDNDNLLVRARSVLLDALDALAEHHDSVIVIGAQAIYLHTGDAPVAVAEATKDSDLAVDVRALRQDPLIDAAMEHAGFVLDPVSGQPGAWISPDGIPVDLMVPEAIAGGTGSRGAVHPPHKKRLS